MHVAKLRSAMATIPLARSPKFVVLSEGRRKRLLPWGRGLARSGYPPRR